VAEKIEAACAIRIPSTAMMASMAFFFFFFWGLHAAAKRLRESQHLRTGATS